MAAPPSTDAPTEVGRPAAAVPTGPVDEEAGRPAATAPRGEAGLLPAHALPDADPKGDPRVAGGERAALHPGAAVVIVNLRKATCLNGRQGRLLCFDPASDRWQVEVVGTDAVKLLRPANVCVTSVAAAVDTDVRGNVGVLLGRAVVPAGSLDVQAGMSAMDVAGKVPDDAEDEPEYLHVQISGLEAELVEPRRVGDQLAAQLSAAQGEICAGQVRRLELRSALATAQTALRAAVAECTEVATARAEAMTRCRDQLAVQETTVGVVDETGGAVMVDERFLSADDGAARRSGSAGPPGLAWFAARGPAGPRWGDGAGGKADLDRRPR